MAHWTTADGLPQNTINDIVVLPNGELWLATFGGLVRFDGAGFQVIDIAGDEALPSNRITAMVPAGADAVWFVTQEGHLGRLEGGRVRTLIGRRARCAMSSGSSRPRRSSTRRPTDGSLWTSEGTRPWRPLMTAPRPGAGGPNFLAYERRDARTRRGPRSTHGVVSLSPAGGARPHALPMLAMAITGGAGSDLWLGLRGGVARYRGGRLEALDIRPAIETTVTAILHVSDTELWVAGEGVVSRLTAQPDGTWTRADLPLDLPRGLFVRALAIDGEGSLWIGTNGRGLLRANRHPTQRFGARGRTRGDRRAGPRRRAWRLGLQQYVHGHLSRRRARSGPCGRPFRAASPRPRPADAGTPSRQRAVARCGSAGSDTCTA